jgi:hypothetical protein
VQRRAAAGRAEGAPALGGGGRRVGRGGHLGFVERLAGAAGPGGRVRAIHIDRITVPDLAQPRLHSRVRVGHHQGAERLPVQDVHGACLGDAGHGQARDALQRRLVVERGGE